jgi:hypothetical protein
MMINNINQENNKLDLDNLEQFMLYDIYIINEINNNNINKKKLSTLFDKKDQIIKSDESYSNLKNKSYSTCNLEKPINKLIFPKNNDKLFWCLYILRNGINDYNLNISNYFSIEKTLKINAISYMKSNKLNIKIKKTSVENNLLYDKKLSIESLSLLCKIYNINLRLINSNFYYEFLNNADDKIFKIYQENGKYGIDFEDRDDDIFNKLLIVNIQKPINSITFYKLNEIVDLASKLKIELYNTNKKHKLKKELYDEIYNILNNV